ncbi:AorFlbE-like protein [Thelonectria olida]|uniref:AorFlbE-like protein n=1 Tax=Thelonectria olida TaxID=1576542 RepID=A0A9P8WBZ6_9HYPO|nr:AorFlbE-like protein [Thelonectria olida]
MPTYLCHGFRWHRRDIRIFVILHDLEDAAPNWVIGPASSLAILSQFHALYDFLPDPPPPAPPPPVAPPKRPLSPLAFDPKMPLMHRDDDHSMPLSRVADDEDHVRMHSSWSPVMLLEEFDPDDLMVASRPYAYVADYVTRIDLSADVVEEMAKYRMRGKGEWFQQLRDEVQKGEDIRWYVVVCGDDVREVPGDSGSEDVDDSDEEDMSGEERPMDVINDGLRPPPSRTGPEQRPRTSPAGTATTDSASAGSLPLRPSPLGSHPSHPIPKMPPEPENQKQPGRPPLRSKKSMAEGLRRLFGVKKDKDKDGPSVPQ